MRDNIALILSIAVFVTLVASVCVKRRRLSLSIQATSCLIEALYSFIIGALTGAVINIINFIRSGLFINRDKFGRIAYLFILVFFDVIILANCYLTWDGPASLLPTIGSLVRTYCLWQTDMRLVRVSGITTGLSYGAYYAIYGGWLMVLGYAILLIVGIYEIITKDVAGHHRRVAGRASAYHRRLCYQEVSSRR